MNAMRLTEAAAVLAARHVGADAVFRSVSIDSRTLESGALFVALRGPRFDGHDYVAAAAGRGATGAMVARTLDVALPQLVVEDPRAALAALAADYRSRLHIPVVAVTGSNGKTTVKEMIGAILRETGSVLVTQGNLNNELGVPLTLLRIDADHAAAVVEMGANHPGEISRLSRMAMPTAALITNAGPAHLEGFGSVEGVAHAKGEIFEGLVAGGTAVINADDPYADLWRRLAGRGRRILSFGLGPDADVRAEAVTVQPDASSAFTLVTPQGSVPVTLPLPGRHNVLNAAAAAAAALAAGARPAAVRCALAGVRGAPRRLQVRAGRGGARILDDTYNANPGSLAAALDTLQALPGVHWLALGDMGELGPGAAALHAEVGRRARAAGVERLYAVGELSRGAARAFGAGAQVFADADALAAALGEALRPGVTVLVKGSRFMAMERVVEALAAEAAT